MLRLMAQRDQHDALASSVSRMLWGEPETGGSSAPAMTREEWEEMKRRPGVSAWLSEN